MAIFAPLGVAFAVATRHKKTPKKGVFTRVWGFSGGVTRPAGIECFYLSQSAQPFGAFFAYKCSVLYISFFRDFGAFLGLTLYFSRVFGAFLRCVFMYISLYPCYY